MSGAFSFPPPPAPPPKAAPTSSDAYEPHCGWQDRARGRGRGRGRAGLDARGRGRNRGGFQPEQRSQQWNQQDHGRAGSQNSLKGSHQPNSSLDMAQFKLSQARSGGLPSGTYVNPNFAPLGNGQISDQQPGPNRPSLPSGSPPRTLAEHKRKRDALRRPEHEKRPTTQAPPAVPSFGPPILPSKPPSKAVTKPPPVHHQSLNALGLTPGDSEPVYSSSDDERDDEDVDEEALHAELGAKLTFEHNGAVLSLSSAADLAAWQNERKKNWPNRARMVEKEAERRQIGEERKRLLASAAMAHRTAETLAERNRRGAERSRRFAPKQHETKVSEKLEQTKEPAAKSESELEKTRRQLKAQEQKVAALRERVARGQAALDVTRSQQSEHDDIHRELSDETKSQLQHIDGKTEKQEDSDMISSTLSVSSVVSSATHSEPDTDSDDDGPPEEAPSKQVAADYAGPQRPACRFFAASGNCRDGEACQFRHELAPGVHLPEQRPAQQPKRDVAPNTAPSGETDRKGIYQRLIEQQREEEDKLALQVIKYLGEAGFFSAESVV